MVLRLLFPRPGLCGLLTLTIARHIFRPPPNIDRLVTSVLRWYSAANNLDPARFSAHIIRPGGALALFFPGAIFEFGRRCGRYAALRPHDYQRFDGVIFESSPAKAPIAQFHMSNLFGIAL